MNNKFVKNVSWIFVGNVVHAVFQYFINIICARFFGANDYGVINYASSIIAFFITVGTLGFNGIITKKFAEDEENAGEYLGTAIITRIVFAIISIICIQIVMICLGETIVMKSVVFCQSLQILFGTADLVLYWYQYKNNARLVAIIRLTSFFVSAIWKLVAILVFSNITLYVFGVSLETLLFGLILMSFYKKDYSRYKLAYNVKCLKNMIRISYPFIFSALLITIYAQTDKIMLKNMLSETSVGLYSVSQTLAGAIAIIPSALIDGFRPEIMSKRASNIKEYNRRLQQLYGIVFWISIAYCVFINVFSKQLVNILYGKEYLGAVSSLSWIVWYTSFSYFGSINNLYMVAENKTVWVQVNTLVGALVNIGLNFLLIPKFGIVGAAVASLITQIIANFLMLIIVRDLRENFYILLKGISFKWLK